MVIVGAVTSLKIFATTLSEVVPATSFAVEEIVTESLSLRRVETSACQISVSPVAVDFVHETVLLFPDRITEFIPEEELATLVVPDSVTCHFIVYEPCAYVIAVLEGVFNSITGGVVSRFIE